MKTAAPGEQGGGAATNTGSIGPAEGIPAGPARQDSDVEADFASACDLGGEAGTFALRHFGVPWTRIMETGGIGAASITTTGRLWEFADGPGTAAVVQPVYLGDVLSDLLAWCPQRTNVWWFRRGESGLALGSDVAEAAESYNESIMVYRTPLSWLQQPFGPGVCPLDRHAMRRLSTARKLGFESPNHRTRMHRVLQQALPELVVPR